MKSTFESTGTSSLVLNAGRLADEVNPGPPVKPGLLEGGIDGLLSTVWKDNPETAQIRKEVIHYAGGMAKTAALFMPGKYGVAATVAVNILDSVKYGDTIQNQLVDGSLGAAKGLGLRAVFAASNYFNLSAASKGVILGISMRSLETGLNRQSYLDKDGNLSFATGLDKVKNETFNKDAIRADILIFGGSHFIQHKLFGNLSSSPFAATLLNGAVFGTTSGAIGEINRQRALGSSSIDYTEVLKRAAIQGTLDSVAAIPAGLMNRSNYRKEMALREQQARQEGAELGRQTTTGTVRIDSPGRSSARTVEAGKATGVQSAAVQDGNGRAARPAQRGNGTGEPIRLTEQAPAILSSPSAEFSSFLAKLEQPSTRTRAVNDISKLPSADRLAAVEATLKVDPGCRALRFALKSVPPEMVPRLADAIVSAASGATRAQLLSSLPMHVFSTLPVNTRVQTLGEVFKRVSALEPEAARQLWSLLPEDPGSHAVRNGLINLLSAHELARVAFGNEPAVVEKAGRIADQSPELVKVAASAISGDPSPGQIRDVINVLATWTSSGSLEQTVRSTLSQAAGTGERAEAPAATVVGHLFKSAGSDAQKRAVAAIREVILQEHSMQNEARLALALETAARMHAIAPDLVSAECWARVQTALSNDSRGYDWRTFVISEIAVLQRDGLIPPEIVKFPELRMARVDLPGEQQSQLRQQLESALRDTAQLQQLLGAGQLGRAIPKVFGNHAEGGIMDRPQAGPHEFTVGEQCIKTVEHVLKHPDFAKLPSKDQTNLLLAALLTGTGRRAGNDSISGHEPVSAGNARGVLESLGYHPVRIERIASLIADHSRLGGNGEKSAVKLTDRTVVDDLAARHLHESSLLQAKILRQATLRAIDSHESHWSTTVKQDVDDTSSVVGDRVRELGRFSIPILTSDLPRSFGLYPAGPNFSFFVHVSPDLPGPLLRTPSAVESPGFSASLSLARPGKINLFEPANIVAIFSGPPERISQAAGESLGTGTGIGWRGHVELLKAWSDGRRGEPYVQLLNQQLGQLGFGHGRQSLPLADVRKRLSRFDSLTELQAAGDPRLLEAHRIIMEAMTAEPAAGVPHRAYSEVKMNSPVLSGVGIVREGRPVMFEGLGTSLPVSVLLGGRARPTYLVPDGSASSGIRIPRSLWTDAQRHSLPIVVLD